MKTKKIKQQRNDRTRTQQAKEKTVAYKAARCAKRPKW